MIDEKKLIFEKIKGTASDYLTESMAADLNAVVEAAQQAVDKKFLEWIDTAQKYVNAEELIEIYQAVCEKHVTIRSRVSSDAYKKVREMNEQLEELEHHPNTKSIRDMLKNIKKTRVQNTPVKRRKKKAIKNNQKLKDLLKALNIKPVKRRKRKSLKRSSNT